MLLEVKHRKRGIIMIQEDCGLIVDFEETNSESSACFIIYNEKTEKTSRCTYSLLVHKEFTKIDDFVKFFRAKYKVADDTTVVLSSASREALEDIVKHSQRIKHPQKIKHSQKIESQQE